MQFFTDFADQAVILPILGLACCALAAAGWRRAALAVGGAAVATLTLVMVSKMFFVACAAPLTAFWRLRSPSGHTASAALVYGGLTALLVPWPRRDQLALLGATASAAVFGASRLTLGVHSLADVLAGAGIGIGGAYTMVRAAGPRPARPARQPVLLAAALGTALLFHGWHLPAEEGIDMFARTLWPSWLCVP